MAIAPRVPPYGTYLAFALLPARGDKIKRRFSFLGLENQLQASQAGNAEGNGSYASLWVAVNEVFGNEQLELSKLFVIQPLAVESYDHARCASRVLALLNVNTHVDSAHNAVAENFVSNVF